MHYCKSSEGCLNFCSNASSAIEFLHEIFMKIYLVYLQYFTDACRLGMTFPKIRYRHIHRDQGLFLFYKKNLSVLLFCSKLWLNKVTLVCEATI